MNAPQTLLSVATKTIREIANKLSASMTIGMTNTSGGIG